MQLNLFEKHTALCFGLPNLSFSSMKDSPIFHLSERFTKLEKKIEKRRVLNFSLGHGGNVREFGSPCPGCRFSCKKMKKQQSKTNVKNNKKDNKNKILE